MIFLKKLHNGFYALNMTFQASPLSAILYVILIIIEALSSTAGMTLATADFVNTATEILLRGFSKYLIYKPLINLLLLLGIINTVGTFISLTRSSIKRNIQCKFSPMITKKLSSLEFKHIESKDSWELISRVSDNTITLLMEVYDAFMSLLKIIIYIISVLGIIMAYVWWAAILIFLFSAPLMWLSVRAGRRNYQATKESEVYNRRVKYLEDVITGKGNIEERTLFGYGNYVSDKWQEQYEKGRKYRLKVSARHLLLTRGSSLGLNVIIVLVALTLINPVISGYLSSGMYMGLIGAIIGVLHYMGWDMARSLETIANANEFMKEFKKYLELDESEGALRKPDVEPIVFSSLEFRGVSFKYPSDKKYILKNLSFRLESGKNYAFVGKNGAGKTTITKLMTGLYKEYEGEILLNGKELREYSAGTLKATFSIIYQDFSKYYVSLKDNIVIGDISGSELDRRICEVIDDAGLKDIVVKLKNGTNTLLGRVKEDGQDLSGGEWQRVAIARSLISRAPIKIMDEPTAALDPISENQLYTKLRRLMEGKTTVFISHRLGSTKLADKILVIEDGHILESGTHNELIAAKGQYSEMFEAQRSWYS